MFICINLLKCPYQIAGYATNGPKLVRFNDTIVITDSILSHVFHQISSAVGVFGATSSSSSSDAIATPIVSY